MEKSLDYERKSVFWLTVIWIPRHSYPGSRQQSIRCLASEGLRTKGSTWEVVCASGPSRQPTLQLSPHQPILPSLFPSHNASVGEAWRPQHFPTLRFLQDELFLTTWCDVWTFTSACLAHLECDVLRSSGANSDKVSASPGSFSRSSWLTEDRLTWALSAGCTAACHPLSAEARK